MESINISLTVILAALSAFFTLITGAFAVGVTMGLIYFRKLASDRKREIEKVAGLEADLSRKITEAQGVLNELIQGGANLTIIASNLDALREDYYDLRNRFFHGGLTPSPVPTVPTAQTAPTGGFIYDHLEERGSTSVAELQAQIQALLSQIAELQEQLSRYGDEEGNGKG